MKSTSKKSTEGTQHWCYSVCLITVIELYYRNKGCYFHKEILKVRLILCVFVSHLINVKMIKQQFFLSVQITFNTILQKIIKLNDIKCDTSTVLKFWKTGCKLITISTAIASPLVVSTVASLWILPILVLILITLTVLGIVVLALLWTRVGVGGLSSITVRTIIAIRTCLCRSLGSTFLVLCRRGDFTTKIIEKLSKV